MPRRMTNRQLARWLQLGKGQMLIQGVVHSHYSYRSDLEDRDVPDYILIRKTGTTTWRVPQLEEDDNVRYSDDA